jgi:hypothetical protein
MYRDKTRRKQRLEQPAATGTDGSVVVVPLPAPTITEIDLQRAGSGVL